MKTTQEIERHISLNGDVARNDIYAKVLFHNIVGVLRKEINHELEKRKTEKTYVFLFISYKFLLFSKKSEHNTIACHSS